MHLYIHFSARFWHYQTGLCTFVQATKHRPQKPVTANRRTNMKNRFGQGMTLSTLAGMTLLGLAHTAQADVNIGAILPLTGTSASIGEDQRRGMELAVEQVNAQGGVNGQPLHVIVEDSAESPVTGLNAVRKLTQVNHVPLVMGSFSSSVTIRLGNIW
jgi:branched-chain amino acid transport system substrate-binding protein